jgi:signal transduction histidine kinase
MSLRSDLPSHALPAGFSDGIAARSMVGVRVSTTTAQKLVAVAIVPMVAVTLWFGLTSDHLERPVAEAVYRSYLTAAFMAVGLYWWVRRPASRFGRLLVLSGVLVWMVSWQASNAPLLFNLGVLAEAPTFILAFYLLVAFPMGRAEPAAARWLIGGLWALVLAFFVPWALFSPAIAGAGPLNRCLPACPQNVLQIASAPAVVDWAGKAETYGALAVTVAVLLVYARRLSTASSIQRRGLLAVAVTSLLYLPAYFISTFAAEILMLKPSTLETLAWGAVGARVLVPLGFLLALLQADRVATRASRTLLERLVGRPTPEQWRDAIAEALDDPALRLGYYDPAAGGFRAPDGDELPPPPAAAGRAWLPVDRGVRPIAAMVVDETLAENPELVGAAASATLIAVENGALEGELRASRARVLEAGHAERRRIERDLHDSAQQRLVALRIHLSLAGEKLANAQDRAMLERFDTELEQAIDDLRDVTHGPYPELLAHAGPGAALKEIAARTPITINVWDSGLARHSNALEATLYFCCLECLQNAAKHAGPATTVAIRLGQRHGHVSFRVEDDGPGFDPATVRRGAGLTNLEHRLAAVGGTLRIDARPGHGTLVTGDVPTAE